MHWRERAEVGFRRVQPLGPGAGAEEGQSSTPEGTRPLLLGVAVMKLLIFISSSFHPFNTDITHKQYIVLAVL